uniref:Uncharacterized protein n=1 Tax=Oryza nivara TaxID=4536 RepID=A0A0E0HY32_ORYNI
MRSIPVQEQAYGAECLDIQMFMFQIIGAKHQDGCIHSMCLGATTQQEAAAMARAAVVAAAASERRSSSTCVAVFAGSVNFSLPTWLDPLISPPLLSGSGLPAHGGRDSVELGEAHWDARDAGGDMKFKHHLCHLPAYGGSSDAKLGDRRMMPLVVPATRGMFASTILVLFGALHRRSLGKCAGLRVVRASGEEEVAPCSSRAKRAGSSLGTSRAEPGFQLVRITSRAELARYPNELDRAEPS